MDRNDTFFTQTAPLWPISGTRIIIGVLWLFSLRWKLPPTFMPSNPELRGLMDWLLLQVEHPAFGFYAEFVSNIVIPNFFLFAWLIFLTELFVGLSLLTGTVTRLGAFIGLIMSLNLAVGLLEVPGEWPWSYAMMAMFHGIFLFTAPGRVLGVDKWLRDTAFQPWWVRILT